jgi:serine protease Do
VRIQDVTPDVAEAMGLPVASGALVTDVPEGPAMEAGMLAGDVITQFNGQSVEDTRDLTRRVAAAPIGAAVPVVVLREGTEETLQVTLGRREDEEARAFPAAAEPEAPGEGEMLGLSLQEVAPEMAEGLGLPADATGLAVTAVDVASEAYEKGLREGDVITEAGQRPVATVQDLTDRVTEARDAGRNSLLLLVRRAGDPRFVALTVTEAQQ